MNMKIMINLLGAYQNGKRGHLIILVKKRVHVVKKTVIYIMRCH